MRKFILSLLLFIPALLSGQGITNLFMGGYDNEYLMLPFGGNKVDFYSGQPVIGQEFRAIDYDFTGTNITDSIGNLLFTTNGVIILNNINDTMVNGTGLNPSNYTTSFIDGLRMWQPNIILPDLMNENQYFLFHMTLDHTGANPYADYLYLSKIDMSLNNGNGEVILKNQIFFSGILSAVGLSACKHANGRDWWFIVRQYNGSEFYFFLLTPQGPIYSHTQAIGTRVASSQTCFSPDGTKLGSYSTDDDFELFDFDRCSGLLSNYRHVVINDSMVSVGASFSPNSQYLYGSSSLNLYQIDASSNLPDTTLQTVAIWDGTFSPNPPFSTNFFVQQSGVDGKIYISTSNSTLVMHTIDEPDSAGIACNVQQHSVQLPTFNLTMPNHPNYNLGPLIGSGCDTLTAINEMILNTPLALNVFPNPVSSSQIEIKYSLEQNQTGELEIINYAGKKVFYKVLPQWSSYQNLNLAGLSDGIYLMRLKSGEKMATFKFVKHETF